MGFSKQRSKSFGIPTKLSLPFVLALCAGCFYGGFLFGERPLTMPDIRHPTKQATVEKKEEVPAVVNGNAAKVNGEHTRRELAADEPKAPAFLPVPAGESGDNFVEQAPFQILSWKPRAILFPKFAPDDKCEEIVAQATRNLAPSGLALRKGESADNTRDVRTSSGTFLSSAGNPTGALAWVENKMARVTQVPPSHGEAFNVLRYELNQHYDSHYDTFNPAEYGPQPSQRIASFLLYLTDVEEGGETMFPYEGGRNMFDNYDFKKCIGLTIRPRKGDALLFWSIYPNGTLDPHSLHGSCPVRKGTKFVATKWIRNKSMRLWF